MLDLGYGDAQEREEAERADEHSERAQALLHASAIRYCPACGVDVLTNRRGQCVWDDGPTILNPASRPTSRPRISSPASAPDPSNGAEVSETTPDAAPRRAA